MSSIDGHASTSWGLIPPTRLVPLRTHSRSVDAPVERTSFRPHLRPIAAWRMDCSRFDFDSSFIGPHARDELPHLATLRARFPGSPAAIFGHTDPSGSDAYNKELSGRRALALYALLVRNLEIWEWLYSSPRPSDDWGTRALQTMLAQLVRADGQPYYTGEIDGEAGSGTRDALEAFQSEHVDESGEPLKVDGKAGPKTRKALFAAYMDALCVDADGAPYRLTDADFLADGGGDDHRAAVQGCGEFNPLMVFSKEQEAHFAKAKNHDERDVENSINRRAVVFLYPSNVTIDPEKWPCPHAREGAAGCRKRFWSDHADRRGAQESQRFFDGEFDTFGCRFYHYIGHNTPAESPVHLRPTFDVYVDEGEYPAGQFVLATTDGVWSERLSLQGAPTLRDADGNDVACVSFVGLPPDAEFTLSFEPAGEKAEAVLLMEKFRMSDFTEAAPRFASEPSSPSGEVDPILFAEELPEGTAPPIEPAPWTDFEVVETCEWEGTPIVIGRRKPVT